MHEDDLKDKSFGSTTMLYNSWKSLAEGPELNQSNWNWSNRYSSIRNISLGWGPV